MPRFVILRHQTPTGTARASHWDFMLEANDLLRTWALDQEPQLGHTVSGESLGDHRIAYLDYEGPVSGGRGHVTQWDRGQYVLLEETDDRLMVQLTGSRLRGTVTLIRGSKDTRQWRVSFGT